MIRYEFTATRPLRLDPSAFRAALETAMGRFVFTIRNAALLNLTDRFLKVGTGRLRSSIGVRVHREGAQIIGVVGTDVFYGRIHEDGVPHSWPIFPRRGRALKFQAGGKTVFASRVTHPPLPSRPWLRTAFEEQLQGAEAIFAAEVRRVVEGTGDAK